MPALLQGTILGASPFNIHAEWSLLTEYADVNLNQKRVAVGSGHYTFAVVIVQK